MSAIRWWVGDVAQTRLGAATNRRTHHKIHHHTPNRTPWRIPGRSYIAGRPIMCMQCTRTPKMAFYCHWWLILWEAHLFGWFRRAWVPSSTHHPTSLIQRRPSNPYHTRKTQTSSIELRAVERGIRYSHGQTPGLAACSQKQVVFRRVTQKQFR